MKIDNLSSVFLIEFIEIFFLNNNSNNVWNLLNNILLDYLDFIKEDFNNFIKNSSHDLIHSKFMSFLKYNLYFPSLEEIEIIIQFLYNFSNILLNDLYPSKLIYLLPVKIIFLLASLNTFVAGVLVCLDNDPIDILDYSNSYLNEKETYTSDIIILTENCLKQYSSIFSKIISDKCVKIIPLKSIMLNILQTSLLREIILTDEQIISLFNFINENINNEDYENAIFNFTKIFNNNFKTSQKTFTDLGCRFYKLFKQKEKNNTLRITLILLYNNINSSLSDLEENLTEFKQNNNNNINNNINNNNDGILTSPINNDFSDNLNNTHSEINNVNSNNENNKSQINDIKILEKLSYCMIDANWQFIKLNNFYSLASDITELYDFGSFENKFLDNLFLSIYSIIFSYNDFGQINDKKLEDSYNKLIKTILTFYNIIFKNISLINKENIKKELSKRRNIYHLKDIGKCLNNIIRPKKEKKINDKIKYFNSFLISLEKIIPEKDVINLNNNDDSKSFGNNNLCPICFDSAANNHLLPCKHLICKNCYLQCISGNKLCPFCRIKIKGTKEDKNC